MNKLQLTFTDQEIGVFEAKASEFGYDVTKFIKFELAKLFEKLKEERISPKLEKLILETRQDYFAGKLQEAKDFRKIGL